MRKRLSRLAKRSVGAIAIVGVGVGGGLALATAETIQKLKTIHQQEVLLERMIKDACFVKLDIGKAEAVAALEVSRKAFDNGFDTMVEQLSKMDMKNPRVKSIAAKVRKKGGQWQLFDQQVKKALAHGSDASAPVPGLTSMRLQKNGIVDVGSDTYKLLKRKLGRDGTVTLGEILAEQQNFQDLAQAERLVKRVCYVAAMDTDEARGRLAETLTAFTQYLDQRASNALVDPKVKALDPAWRAELPALEAIAKGATPDRDVLERLANLSRDYASVVDQTSGIN